MTTMYQSEFDELARALAALLATWWRYRGRTDEATQSCEPLAQNHLARLDETTGQARAPPGSSLDCTMTPEANAIDNLDKERAFKCR